MLHYRYKLNIGVGQIMAKSKFDLNKVIEMQDQGCTIEDILQAMEYKRISNLKGHMTKVGYTLVDDKFIPMEIQQATEPTQQQQQVEQQDNNINTQDDTKESLELILKTLKQVERHMLNDKYELHIPKEDLKLKPFSIRANEDDLKAFNELCDNQYSHISKSYLFSRALREFVEKYR